MCEADGTPLNFSLTGHLWHCPKCRKHLTLEYICPECGTPYGFALGPITCLEVLYETVQDLRLQIAIYQAREGWAGEQDAQALKEREDEIDRLRAWKEGIIRG